LPTLRLLTRPAADIEALCRRVEPAVAQATRNVAHVSVVPCHSQIGSGALPVDLLPSTALALAPLKLGRGKGAALRQLAAAPRAPRGARLHRRARTRALRAQHACRRDRHRLRAAGGGGG